MPFSFNILDAVVFCGCFVWLRCIINWRRQNVPLPPGPPRLPLFGNVFDMPKTLLWEKASLWKEEYGDLIYLENFGAPLVIINSYEMANDLLDKRSIKYSSRPCPTMSNELQGWTWLTVLTPYGNQWKNSRAPIQRAFNSPDVDDYKDVQRQSSRRLLADLLREPGNYSALIKSSIVRIIMLTTYGHEVLGANDPYVPLVAEASQLAGEAAMPGRWLVDILPLLKHVPAWFPGAQFQAIAQKGRQLSHDMRYIPYEDARAKILHGHARPSLMSHLVEQRLVDRGELTTDDDDLISAIAGMIYAGGSDTTGSVLLTFVLAMTLFPEAQKKAQLEIDQVIGNDRLPDFDDREKLPFIGAIYKECLRYSSTISIAPVRVLIQVIVHWWSQPLPLGIPHLLTEDDTYNGYFLPAGTLVAANQWWMMYDPAEFPEPEIFRPERFLPAPGKKLPLDPSKVVFGFGRRICAGKMMADNTIYITIASILAAFDITAPTDKAGRRLPPLGEYNTASVVSHPMPFDCKFTPRSEMTANLIAQAFDLHC